MRRDYEGACGTKGPNDATDRAAGTDEAGSKSGRTNQRRTAASFPPSPARGGGRNGVSEPIAAARRRAHGSSAEVAWHPVFVGHSSASGADFGFRHSIRRTQGSGPQRSRPRLLDRIRMIGGSSLQNDHAPHSRFGTRHQQCAMDPIVGYPACGLPAEALREDGSRDLRFVPQARCLWSLALMGIP